MQDAVSDLAQQIVSHANHNLSWAFASVSGGSATVAVAASVEANGDWWLYLTRFALVAGLAFTLSGLVRFYWDLKARIIAASKERESEIRTGE